MYTLPRRALGWGLALALVPTAALAQPAPPGHFFNEWQENEDRSEDPEPSELRFIGYFFTRFTGTNMVSDPVGLKGVSLGPVGLPNGSGVRVRPEDGATAFVEQRLIPVLTYSPHFIDGLASLNLMFEVDFLWGFGANSLGQNTGGGFNLDQVNLQTKNVNVALYPTRNPGKLSILLGAQPVYDNVYDPTVTSVFDIARTGYKMAFLASDATGVSVFGKYFGRWKASLLPLLAGQPDRALEADPRLKFVWMMTLDYQYAIRPETNVGVSFWRLQDDSKGGAKIFEQFVDAGPGSGGLSPFTGTRAFNLRAPEGHVYHAGAHFDHNVRYTRGPFAASGFVMGNFGRFGSTGSIEGTSFLPETSILGGSANLELGFNWGKTTNDVITLEGMFSTGDSDPTDDEYTGAFTMNYYGLPGAVWLNSRTLILFPFSQTVSNFTGGVTDLSNQGFGLVSGVLSAAWDIIPYRLNLKLGTAYGQTAVKPTPAGDGTERGKTLGLEINAELTYTIRYLMNVGLHAGYMFTGNFYDGRQAALPDGTPGLKLVDGNIWAVFSTFTWYAF